ncbi:pyridoxamine 5'-phosphate oxidase family protein [Nocardioides zhouii]|uniref:Pyridoxamine 5'-phosphate oxidase family protein n=1 Tax=Nocardioides zhouii TaxID=1168729 RepID=A0A4Q2T8L2_9ACTN|nr:pyridoxamine 5'-phosphate oxidase family protein [Nocardioides zhouii]RYC14613.1 pyridoxamine 5'-phosphate oxidase family protein [Nocardioides zhouii]
MADEPQERPGRSAQRTDVRRLPEKQVRDVAALHAILDEAVVASVGIAVDGQPFVLPMACARDGDHLLLHGSTGSRLMRAIAAGTPICVSVTHLDGLVYARSAFESSMRYRSATVLGVATAVPADERLHALEVLTEHLLPGRWAELRAPHAKELAATSVLRVPLAEWSVKVGAGFGDDPDEDLDEPVWAGMLPMRVTYGDPVDAPDLGPGRPVPGHVTGLPDPGQG